MQTSLTPFTTDYSAWIKQFRDLPLMDKVLRLGQMDTATRNEFFRQYVVEPTTSLSDVIGLPSPFSHWAKFHLVGNKKNNITPQTRTFYVEPTSSAPNGVVRLEEPSRNGRRHFKIIDGPVALPANKAIQALECFGPKAETVFNRGWLREMTEEEFLLKSATARQLKLSEALQKDKAEAEAKIEEAKALLEAAGQSNDAKLEELIAKSEKLQHQLDATRELLNNAKAEFEAAVKTAPVAHGVELEDLTNEQLQQILEKKGLKLTAASKRTLEAEEVSEQADPTTDPIE